jgi:hypothetical protein
VRLIFALEEHGGGKQLARFRWWPRYSRAVAALIVGFGALTAFALLERSLIAFGMLGAMTLAVTALALSDCAAAAGSVVRALEDPLRKPAYEAIPEPVPWSSPARADRNSDGWGDAHHAQPGVAQRSEVRL